MANQPRQPRNAKDSGESVGGRWVPKTTPALTTDDGAPLDLESHDRTYLITVRSDHPDEDEYVVEAATATEAIQKLSPGVEIIDRHPRAADTVYEIALGVTSCADFEAVAFDPANQIHVLAAKRALTNNWDTRTTSL